MSIPLKMMPHNLEFYSALYDNLYNEKIEWHIFYITINFNMSHNTFND